MRFIARKPKHFKETIHEEGRCRGGDCPKCGRYLCDWEQYKTCNYCQKCGQKLNWGWKK